MQSQLTAHVSMLNALREEKRLWEQELAQQGDHVIIVGVTCALNY